MSSVYSMPTKKARLLLAFVIALALLGPWLSSPVPVYADSFFYTGPYTVVVTRYDGNWRGAGFLQIPIAGQWAGGAWRVVSYTPADYGFRVYSVHCSNTTEFGDNCGGHASAWGNGSSSVVTLGTTYCGHGDNFSSPNPCDALFPGYSSHASLFFGDTFASYSPGTIQTGGFGIECAILPDRCPGAGPGDASTEQAVYEYYPIWYGVPPTVTSTPTLTSTTDSSTPFPSYLGGCVNATATVSATFTRTPPWHTPQATITPTSGPSLTPTPFGTPPPTSTLDPAFGGGFDAPPGDTALETFPETDPISLDRWQQGSLNSASWVSSLTHTPDGSGSVSMFVGGHPGIVLSTSVYPSTYIDGWVQMPSSNPPGWEIDLVAWVYGDNGSGVSSWINVESSGGSSRVHLLSDSAAGNWQHFAINPGRSGSAFMLEVHDVSSQGLGSVFLDDLQLRGYVWNGYDVPLCNGLTPQPTPTLVTLPVYTPPMFFDGPGFDYEIIIIDDGPNNPCFGYNGFAIHVPFGPFEGDYPIPGFKVCFIRWVINSITIANLDLAPIMELALIVVPLFAVIYGILKVRGG